MRKVLLNIKSTFVMLAAIAGVAVSSVSCQYDDTDIWDKLGELEQEISDLRQQLETELNAIKDMVNGLVTVVDVKQQQDGSKQIVLSDGTKINIYPQGSGVPANLVTTTIVDGVLCWATYDGLGNAQPIYANGKVIPVADSAPMTQVNGNVIEVSFDGGATWIQTGYTESVVDSIIKDVEVVYSDWRTDADGNMLALYCKVTLADGTVIKVGMQNGRIILPYDSVFAAYGETLPFSLDAEDAADFLVTTPKGWECEVEHNAKYGTMLLYFTAPTLETIEAGAAVSEGVVKLMVTFNNGSSAIASIKVSTNPAKVYFTMEGVHVEVGYGTNYMICGLYPASSFTIDKIKGYTQTVLGGGTSSYATQLSFMEETSTYLPYKELRSNMAVGTEYIFWYVVPRISEDGDLYVTDAEFFTESYIHSSVSFKVNSASFFDVDVTFKAQSSANYMLGYAKADEFDAAYIAQYYTEHPDYLSAVNQDMTYTGSFVELFTYGAELEYGTEYVAYYLAENSKHVYLEDNVVFWSFSTQDYTRDGSMEVSVIGEPTIAYDYIEMTLNTTEEHIMMFYNAMPSYMASAYPDDTYVIDMLLEEGYQVKSNEAVVARYDGVKPGTKLTFFAVAVDAEGKIGKPFKQEYTTKDIEYNADLVLTAELKEYKIDNTLINLSCEGATNYAYILCKTSDAAWKEVYGGTVKKAGEYIIMNNDSYNVYKTQEPTIALTGLDMDVEYVVVAIAYAADGTYSEATSCYFKPIANIGTVVTRDQAQWEQTKPTVSILMVEDNPHLFMSFSWSCLPAPHTKIYTAAMYRDNLINEELDTNVNTVEKLIAEIMTCCDTGGMNEQGKSFEWQENGIYLREWVEWEDTDGDNYLEEVYHSEVHPYGYHFFPYGSSGSTFIYTTWVCEDGNFHEPFAIDPTTGEEVSLW